MSICNREIQALNLSDAEVELLKKEISQKSEALQKVKDADVNIKKMSDDISESQNKMAKKLGILTKDFKSLSERDRQKTLNNAFLNDYEVPKNFDDEKVNELIKEYRELDKLDFEPESTKKMFDVFRQIKEYRENQKGWSSLKSSPKEQEKFSAFDEHYKSLKKTRAQLRKLRSEQNKIFNNVKDEISGDYQRYAKYEAINNISSLQRLKFLEQAYKDPKKVRDVFFNFDKITTDSLTGRHIVYEHEFKSYMNNYDMTAIENAPLDLDLSDMKNEHIRSLVKYIRDFMDKSYLVSRGEKFFKSDKEHIANINGDKMRANFDQFIKDIKAYSDNDALTELLNEQTRTKESPIKGFEEASEESPIGAQRIGKSPRTLDEFLNKFKQQIESGSATDIRLTKIPFKDDDSFVKFNKKYSGRDVASSYVTYGGGSFLKRLVVNDAFGGYLDLRTLPKEVFDKSFTPEMAQDALDHFMGGYHSTLDRTSNFIRWIEGSKILTTLSKMFTLPWYTLTDHGTGVGIEIVKNTKDNFISHWSSVVQQYFRGWKEGLQTNLRVAKVAGSVPGRVLGLLQKQQMNKLYEMTKGYANASQVRLMEDYKLAFNNKIMKGLSRLSYSTIFSTLHDIDDYQSHSAWHGITETFKNYDPKNPVYFTERLKDIGFTQKDIDIVQKYIRNSNCATIDIDKVPDHKVRNKLRILRRNSKMSAVPLDVTPKRLFKITHEPTRRFVTFFWGFHLRSVTQVYKLIMNQQGVLNKIASGATLMLTQLPANLAVNALLMGIYTGHNPFSSKYRTELIASSLLGNVSRLGMIGWAIGTGQGNLGWQLSNPLISAIQSTARVGVSSANYALSHSYHTVQDQTKLLDKFYKAVFHWIPGGSIGTAIVDNFSNNS